MKIEYPKQERVRYLKNLASAIDENKLHMVQNDFAKQLQVEISRSFGVPRELLDNPSTASASATQAMSEDTAKAIVENMKQYLSRIGKPKQTPYQKFCMAFLRELSDSGLHPDVLFKLDFVLNSSEGLDFIHTLSVQATKDYEYIVQELLKMYKVMTS